MNEKHKLQPLPYWSPYKAGILLGVALFLAFFIVGRGLGGSGALNRITAFTYETFNYDLAHSYSYYKSYFTGEGSVLNNFALYQLLGVLIGGYFSASVGRRSHLTVEKGPRISTRGRFMFAFSGGVIMAIGARIARGCTSGQILTGGATLALGSWAMMVCFFGGAYMVAWFVRKQWI